MISTSQGRKDSPVPFQQTLHTPPAQGCEEFLTNAKSLSSQLGDFSDVTNSFLTNRQDGGWVHVEWGGANYGETRADESDRFVPTDRQHWQLLEFLDNYIEKHGDDGTFYLNDLCPQAVSDACRILESYAHSKGYTRLKIVEYPGDYNKVEVPISTTARVSHPESSFYRCPGLIRRLQAGANNGLQVTTHYASELSIKMEQEGILGVRLDQTAPYTFPSGRNVSQGLLRGRPAYTWLVSENPLNIIQGNGLVVTRVLDPGTVLYSWGTERRLNRLLPEGKPLPLSEDLYSRLRAREAALLGPGLYTSPNPIEFAGFGKKLMVAELLGGANVLTIPSSRLQAVHGQLEEMGFAGGINSPHFQKYLGASGIQGIELSEDDSIYSLRQIVLISSVRQAILHPGDSFLKELLLKGDVEPSLVAELNFAAYRLNINLPTSLNQMVHPTDGGGIDTRSFLQIIKPFIDRVGTTCLGSSWRRMTDTVARRIMAITPAPYKKLGDLIENKLSLSDQTLKTSEIRVP